MQRHKLHRVYGSQENRKENQQEQPDEDFSQEDNFLKDEAMLFGQNPPPEVASPTVETTDEQAEPPVNATIDIEELCNAKIADMRLRTAAEMENFKKRLAREHEEQMHYAAEKVLSDLLPTLDNLDLALQYGSKNDACKDLLQGVAMTQKLLLDAVAKHGLKPVGKEGDEFDPNVHEAVGFEEKPDYAPNSVARVLQHGYKLGERLLRPAKVMVRQ
ncbi:MAG: nucleotide exchange factor GrpE [Desulfovibrio sp.]|nr:nucleotide exchange factor GrpE [Desulfovibrio sp.]